MKIKISYNDDNEKLYLNDAQQVRFYITMSQSNVGATDLYKVANICATTDISKIIPKVNNVYKTILYFHKTNLLFLAKIFLSFYNKSVSIFSQFLPTL